MQLSHRSHVFDFVSRPLPSANSELLFDRGPRDIKAVNAFSFGLSILLVFLCIAFFSPATYGQSLPVSSDLLLHLDAADLEPVSDGKPTLISEWISRSNAKQKFEQSNTDSRPLLVQHDAGRFVRFDGVNDSLRFLSDTATVNEASLIMVLAPHSNPGEFRGFFSTNQKDRKDYESGFNIDMGPAPSRKWDYVNWEGKGFGGAGNLASNPIAFHSLQIIHCYVDGKNKQAAFSNDGVQFQSRPFQPQPLSVSEMTLGARFYNNGSNSQSVNGFAEVDIAEVLLFSRALSGEESLSIHRHLESKYKTLSGAMPSLAPESTRRFEIEKVSNPPVVQMLVPGFEVRELPISLTNLNNLRYRRDRSLVTLGYNGDIHILRDTDGDGLEDSTQLFWKNTGSLRGPIGMVWIESGSKAFEAFGEEGKKARGVITASKGKVSAIVDLDGDDLADKEWILAQGWNEIRQNVDAVGIALGDDNDLYFGLGTADYANAYQIDEKGNSQYKLDSDRGTIQKVNLSTLQRETLCTGVRFPIGMAFHPNGDLFCTDQEGATWLPNGNPFDELLCIERNKHYGFPPRHPTFNPNVIDEPSVYDYGPQHQSTCGMVWNHAANSPIFGPEMWRDDLFVCGESRGKLWKTSLVKTPNGYVASNQLIAAIQMLTVDCCLSPEGDLLVACHSGPPDWGTGPEGLGRVFKISYEHKEEPLPVAAWSESPTELRIAFDKPIPGSKVFGLLKNISIEYGPYARAGDHFENLVPPYAVVNKQSLDSRKSLELVGQSLAADLKTLLLQVPTLKDGSHYAIRWKSSSDFDNRSADSLEQMLDYSIDTALDGVVAEWSNERGEKESITLPHWDLRIAKELTKHSPPHSQFFSKVTGKGTLRLSTKVDLSNILRPRIQPGSTIDYQWPDETVTLSLSIKGASNFSAKRSANTDKIHEEWIQTNELFESRWTAKNQNDWLEIDLQIDTEDASRLEVESNVLTNEDSRPRVLAPVRLHLPWNKGPNKSSVDEKGEEIAEIQGGNWGRGRRVFHSAAAGCFKCHSMNNIGARIGPDLSNLIHRDYTSVMRDVKQPSYSINPDYIGSVVRMQDGNVLTGVLRTEQGVMLLGDAQGNTHRFLFEDVDEIKSSQSSIMPSGLLDQLTQEQVRDLMTFLLTPPPRMPIEGPIRAPEMRSLEEVINVLEGSLPLEPNPRKITIVLVAGNKDHGPGEHDYPSWQLHWAQLLSASENVEIETAWDFPSDDLMSRADLLVFFQKGDFNKERAAKLDSYQKRGGGAIYLHWAVNGENSAAEFAKRIGLASRAGKVGYRHGPLSLELHNTDHPILRNIDRLQLYDESYWLLSGDPSQVMLLASSVEEGASQPQMWCYEKENGRVFVAIPGHYNWTFDDPIFRTILLRAMAWSTHEPIDRFNDLVLPGARVRR